MPHHPFTRRSTAAIRLLAAACAVLTLASCGSSRPDTDRAGGSRDLSVAAALKEAADDIRSNRAKIYEAGTIGPYEPGISDDDRQTVASLPRSGDLPMGCTEPRALRAAAYAEAYNRAVLAAIRNAK
jgi:hypothetical protein